MFYKEYLKTVISIRNLHKVMFIDTSKYLSHKNRENIDKYFCKNHFNLEGNKLIAKIINDHVLQK